MSDKSLTDQELGELEQFAAAMVFSDGKGDTEQGIEVSRQLKRAFGELRERRSQEDLMHVVVTELCDELAGTHEWLEASLNGERAGSDNEYIILDFLRHEAATARMINTDLVERARALLKR
jgi:hypothetical protein